MAWSTKSSGSAIVMLQQHSRAGAGAAAHRRRRAAAAAFHWQRQLSASYGERPVIMGSIVIQIHHGLRLQAPYGCGLFARAGKKWLRAQSTMQHQTFFLLSVHTHSRCCSSPKSDMKRASLYAIVVAR